MKIYRFKVEDNKLVGGWEAKTDKDIKGYIYVYGNDLESARRDAEAFLEYASIDFKDFDKEIERDTEEDWYKEIWG